jgi:uracil-DNA glycosylase family 4
MMNSPLNQSFDMSDVTRRNQALAGVLEWYRSMGVEAAVEAQATNWLEKGQTPPARYIPAPRASTENIRGEIARPPAPASAPNRPAPNNGGSTATAGPRPAYTRPDAPPSVTLSDDAAEANAREAAQQAKSLEELHALLRSFDGCGLKATAKNLCFYRGAPQARVMIIGEAPGADEDRAGVPFVGRAGQLLDKMLAAIDLSEADTHITNVVYWRPPGNRVPTPQETLICQPFLERQIRLVQPELIVTVGGAAAKLILDVKQGIMKVRGKWGAMEVPAEANEAAMSVTVMPTLHPAYLLRSPGHKRQAWRDLLAIRARLDGTELGG